MAPADSQGAPRDRAKGSARRAARIAAVQAAYQIEATGVPAERVLQEFLRHRLPSPEGKAAYAGADQEFFADLVRGVAADRAELDEMLDASLADQWSIERIDKVLHAILLCGAFEVRSRPDIPPRVAISEYVDVAHAFFEGREPGFVNGVLDRVARVVRSGEMNEPAAETR